MKLGKVLIYLGVLIALAAYVYFVEIKYKQQQEEQRAEAEKILKVDKDKITQVSLKSKKHGTIVVKKANGTWIIAEPVKVKADQNTVRSLLKTISGAQFEKVLKKKDVKWDDYGLDKPEFTVSVTTRDDTVSMFFGLPNPAKTSYYLRARGDSRLLFVADTLKNALDKSVFDLRDKVVFGLAPEDIDTMVITKSGTETELKRATPDTWMMTKPEKIRVKTAEIDRELINLTNLEAKDIIDEPKKDGDPYGLDKPMEKIRLAGKKRDQTLLIGKTKTDKDKPATPNSDRYARLQGQNTVYLIGSQIVANVKTDPEALQDKSLLHFKPEDIEKIQLDLDGKKWKVSRSEDKQWSLEEPEKKKVQPWPITGILWDLKTVQWTRVTKPAPTDLATVQLDKPRLVASLWKKGEKEPMVLKAGWKDKQPKKKEADSESAKTPAGSGPEKRTEEAKSAPKTAGKSEKDPNPMVEPGLPETVNVVVQPDEEKDAVFTVASTFIERIRKELKDLGSIKK
jgi:hypothetical protein